MSASFCLDLGVAVRATVEKEKDVGVELDIGPRGDGAQILNVAGPSLIKRTGEAGESLKKGFHNGRLIHSSVVEEVSYKKGDNQRYWVYLSIGEGIGGSAQEIPKTGEDENGEPTGEVTS